MFTTVQSFVSGWRNESAATQRVMDALTDASLSQRITPDHRSLGQLAWHIATTIHEMVSRTGLVFPAPEGDEHTPAPASAAAIAAVYRSSGKELLSAIERQWSDETLARTTNMYGEVWPNGLTLHILIQHEVHHRGQMIVLMRQAGLRVPDIYGPTREDWLERGMQPLV